MILERFIIWIKNLPNLRGWAAVKSWGISAVILFLIGGSAAYGFNRIFLSNSTSAANIMPSNSAQNVKQVANIPDPINGVLFTAADAAVWKNRLPLAVIIENSVTARPESGLSQADLVYEALAEGGITRQIAIFLTTPTPVTLGPVRSMRVYFLDWLEEYGAVAVHVGGNDHALARISPEGVKDIDGIYVGSPTFIRTTDRYAPHNDYSATDRLWALATKDGYTGSATFQSWLFKSDAPLASRPPTQTINLGFLGDPEYAVKWVYDPKTNLYSKFDGGQPFIDRNNNQQITAKTVVVQEVSYTLFAGEDALNMQDIGSGPAYVFEDGVEVKGTWSKDSRTARTIFYDANNNQIPFDRGQIWIDVVPPNSLVSF